MFYIIWRLILDNEATWPVFLPAERPEKTSWAGRQGSPIFVTGPPTSCRPGETTKVSHTLHHLLGDGWSLSQAALGVSSPWCWGWARWLLAWLGATVLLRCASAWGPLCQQTCSSAEQMSVKSRMRPPDAGTFQSCFFPFPLLYCDTQCVHTA